MVKKSKYFLLNFNKKKFKYLSKYINMMIKNGKKGLVEQGFLDILRGLRKEKKKYNIANYLVRATNEGRPCIGFVSKKRGSITYRIPISLTMNREVFQSIYWIINETCGLKKRNYKKVLLKELLHISSRVGNVQRVKSKLHKIAKYNRVYLKYLS